MIDHTQSVFDSRRTRPRHTTTHPRTAGTAGAALTPPSGRARPRRAAGRLRAAQTSTPPAPRRSLTRRVGRAHTGGKLCCVSRVPCKWPYPAGLAHVLHVARVQESPLASLNHVLPCASCCACSVVRPCRHASAPRGKRLCSACSARLFPPCLLQRAPAPAPLSPLSSAQGRAHGHKAAAGGHVQVRGTTHTFDIAVLDELIAATGGRTRCPCSPLPPNPRRPSHLRGLREGAVRLVTPEGFSVTVGGGLEEGGRGGGD